MSLRLVAENPKQIRLTMAVETCSEGTFALCLGHGKSPCFSQVAFLWLVSPDCRLLILFSVYEVKIMECAL